jgi:hypothetical protein
MKSSPASAVFSITVEPVGFYHSGEVLTGAAPTLAPGRNRSTLLFGLSYNSPYNTLHNKRIIDEKEETRNRYSQLRGSRG